MDSITAVCEIPAALSWGAGLIALTMVGFAIRMETMGARVRDIKSGVDRARVMHEHADDYGFGTVETNRLLRDLVVASANNARESERVCRVVRELTHFIIWEIKDRTGKTPPPPPPEGG